MNYASTTAIFTDIASTTGNLVINIGFPLFEMMIGILLALIFAGGIMYAVVKSIKRL